MTGAYGVPEWAAWVPELTGSEERSSSRLRRLLLGAVVVGLLGAVSVAAVPHLRQSGPPHPDAWDPRVQELVDTVEKERGLDFTEPVFVDFLSPADFKAKLAGDADQFADAGLEVQGRADVMLALGLATRGDDLVGTAERQADAAMVGYYSYAEERIRVRGTELTPAVQSAVVRELTIALQDQALAVGERRETTQGDPTATAALTALAEADARRVETAWRQDLPAEQRATLQVADAKLTERVQAKAGTAPALWRSMTSAPYAAADGLLAVAEQSGGAAAVDDLFTSPPTTEEHQLDPWTFVADRAVPINMAMPTLDTREKEVGHGRFGALAWLLVLAERIPAEQALTAADGWGGDAFVAFRRGASHCARIDYRGDTAQDLSQMKDALTAWVAAGAGVDAKVRREGTLLTLESCVDVRGASPASGSGAQQAISLALSRTYLSTGLVGEGVDTAQARCGADRLVRELTPEQVSGLRLGKKTVRTAVAPCRDEA